MSSPQAKEDRMPFPREWDAIRDRRKAFGLDENEPETFGLALSGGGIRSATFGLGVLRGLGSLGLLQKVDYLSTVSGGGYVGAFYCGLFASRLTADGATIPAVLEPCPAGSDLLSKPAARDAIGYLRQSGRYLTPSGAQDYLYAATVVFRNWLALTLATGVLLLWVFVLLDGARQLFLRWQILDLQHVGISPALFPAAAAAFIAASAGWGYWLTLRDFSSPWVRPPLVGTLSIVVTCAVALHAGTPLPPSQQPSILGITISFADLVRWSGWTIMSAGASATAIWSLAVILEGRPKIGTVATGSACRQDRIRHRLTRWQAKAAAGMGWSSLAAAADMGSWQLLHVLASDSYRIIGVSAIGIPAFVVPMTRALVRRLATLAPRASASVDTAPPPNRLARYGIVLAWAAAVSLACVAISFWGGIAHLLTFEQWGTPVDAGRSVACATVQVRPGWLLPALAASTVLVILVSISDGFVNLSSLSTFYAARLRRAYLGAGNRERIGSRSDRTDRNDGGDRQKSKTVEESLAGDDLDLDDYYGAPKNGAPVHLVNITINRTKGKGPNTVQRDRHGLNMVLSPCGFMYSEAGDDVVTFKPRVPKSGPAVRSVSTPHADLPLSTWIGISGAAFSTGLGSRTNLAFSLIAFLTNVRLGYWWRPERGGARFGAVYCNLLRELLAAFSGTDRKDWYLSDGGHFENTGVYELVRRRVSFIVASDNGYDASYGFEDVANLVRKCRIDFGAEIDILNRSELDEALHEPELRALFAAPSEFAEREAAPKAVAMLASVTYPDGGKSTLLIVKPRLTQDGPADLLRYCMENRDFPQQTTFDQSFDEAQWESYYELGRRLTLDLFRDRNGLGWEPSSFTRCFGAVVVGSRGS